MAASLDAILEPIPISLISGRYLLFDINVVTYLRRTHHICGTLVGSIPQMPQQNIFLGLPLELMPEEARLLVEMKAAYIVDDFAWHKQKFNTFEGADRAEYLSSLRSEGHKARKAAEAASRNRKENALARNAVRRSREESSAATVGHDASECLFNSERPASPGSSTASTASTSNPSYSITPTSTYSASILPQNPSQQPDPPVPSSYHLFAHLHSKDYFLMPGLRFGCDYNVYPGDPLRFHSHFASVSYDWDEEIPLIDLIGGGRLGTRVKKAFLIGGKDMESKEEEGDGVRTFSIEWGGM